ncbi:MAG TPA: hypothetical protein VJ850_09060 [Candidatus Limnocylindrales bacterium]|nr:hypothetical protein [Candidatus Limnocylindrales bacterium]
MSARRVTLHGTLEGPIWWPIGVTAQLPITLDLGAEAARDALRSGMIAAIRSACESAGDFSAMPRLTGDSIIVIEHRSSRLHGWNGRGRVIEVTDLPSLAEYVAADSCSALEWADS